VLIPVRDEEGYIREAAAAMRAQDFAEGVEFLFTSWPRPTSASGSWTTPPGTRPRP
jgi:hypothetical protein